MSTDAARARAHFKWADIYYKKSHAHLARAKHYDRRRRSAFGVGSLAFGVERDQKKTPKTLMVGYNAPLSESFDDDHTDDKGDDGSVWLWQQPGPAQLSALTKLFTDECIGFNGTVTSEGKWAAYRSGQTSGIYMVEMSDSVKVEGVREFVERALTAHPSPSIAMSDKQHSQLRTVEDWREQALLCMESRAWRATKPHETFAYYDFLLTNAKHSRVLYVNKTFFNTFKMPRHPNVGDERFASGSVVLFPDLYFPNTGFFGLGEPSSFAMWMERGKRGADPSVVQWTRCHIDWKPEGPPCEIRPASLVPNSETMMTDFRARMILGLGANGKIPDSTSIQSNIRKAFLRIHPDKQKDLPDSTTEQREKIDLRFTTSSKTLTSAGNFFYPEITVKFGRVHRRCKAK
jgi:hypothetical protein